MKQLDKKPTGNRKKLGIFLIGILVLFVIPCATLGRYEPVERSPEERQTLAVIELTVEATWGPARTLTSEARETQYAKLMPTSDIKVVRAYNWLQWYVGNYTPTPLPTPTPKPSHTPTPTTTVGG